MNIKRRVSNLVRLSWISFFSCFIRCVNLNKGLISIPSKVNVCFSTQVPIRRSSFKSLDGMLLLSKDVFLTGSKLTWYILFSNSNSKERSSFFLEAATPSSSPLSRGRPNLILFSVFSYHFNWMTYPRLFGNHVMVLFDWRA